MFIRHGLKLFLDNDFFFFLGAIVFETTDVREVVISVNPVPIKDSHLGVQKSVQKSFISAPAEGVRSGTPSIGCHVLLKNPAACGRISTSAGRYVFIIIIVSRREQDCSP